MDLKYCRVDSGEELRTIRSAWQPLFHTASLESFTALMHQAAEKAVQRLAEFDDVKEPVDVSAVLGGMTLQVISAAAIGYD